LDTADILAPMVGPPGVELYYRLAQEYEAWKTGFGRGEEAKIRQIYFESYVNPSLMRSSAWVGIFHRHF